MNQALSPLENQKNLRKTIVSTLANMPSDVADIDVEPGDVALMVLGEIARGRTDCGKPINAEEVRQLARKTLMTLGRTWPQNSKAEAP